MAMNPMVLRYVIGALSIAALILQGYQAGQIEWNRVIDMLTGLIVGGATGAVFVKRPEDISPKQLEHVLSNKEGGKE